MKKHVPHFVCCIAFISSLVLVGRTAYAQVGVPDPSFGTGGVNVTHLGAFDYGQGVLVREDGTILVGGYSGDAAVGTNDAMIWSYQADGTPIEGLAFASQPFGCYTVPDFFFGIAEDSSGRVLAGGWAQYDCGGTELDFWAVRYEPGVHWEAFERPAFNGRTDVARAVLALADGRIVAAGQADEASGSQLWDIAFAGFDTDGLLDDTGFGLNGETVIDVAGEEDIVFGLGELSDGRIVGVGYATIAGQRDMAIVRLDSDGTVDGMFGTAGVVTLDLGGYDDYLRSVAVLPDDSIVAAGKRGAADGVDSDFVVVKLDLNGALDPDFGAAGVAVVDFGGSAEVAMSLQLQDDGKILAVGFSESAPGGTLMRDLAAVRLKPNGVLDFTFGVGGKTVVDVVPSQGDVASSLAVEADGDVVVAGYTVDSADFSDVVLVRLLGDENGGLLFASDFETGGLGDWSTVVP